jgi:hypothetical protein
MAFTGFCPFKESGTILSTVSLILAMRLAHLTVQDHARSAVSTKCICVTN